MDGTPTLSPFEPVVTRVITDDASIPRRQTEPAYDIAEWRPPVWDTINTVRTPDGIDQRLVVIPAQYRATSGFLGSERLFTAMTYTLYYSDTRDTLPPRIWSVRDLCHWEPKVLRCRSESLISPVWPVSLLPIPPVTGSGRPATASAQDAGTEYVESVSCQAIHACRISCRPWTTEENVAVHHNKGRYFALRLLADDRLPLISRGE